MIGTRCQPGSGLNTALLCYNTMVQGNMLLYSNDAGHTLLYKMQIYERVVLITSLIFSG